MTRTPIPPIPQLRTDVIWQHNFNDIQNWIAQANEAIATWNEEEAV